MLAEWPIKATGFTCLLIAVVVNRPDIMKLVSLSLGPLHSVVAAAFLVRT